MPEVQVHDRKQISYTFRFDALVGHNTVPHFSGRTRFVGFAGIPKGNTILIGKALLTPSPGVKCLISFTMTQ